MNNCATCGAANQFGRPFCITCGRVPVRVKAVSYASSFGMAAAGLFIVFTWWAMNSLAANNTSTPVVQGTAVHDEATDLISKCGRPDGDSVIPKNSMTKSPEQRWISYKKAGVKVRFQPGNSGTSPAWNTPEFFDAISKKRIQPMRLAKLLPCTVKK